MKIYSFVILGLICLVVFSCSLNFEECLNVSLETYSLEDLYECGNTKHQLEIDLAETFTIIKSQNEFEDLVSGSCAPKIDFGKYDLIIGKKFLTSGNVNIEYDFKTDCENDKVLLKVTFNQNITLVAPNLTYHVLVDKLNENIEVVIEIIN